VHRSAHFVGILAGNEPRHESAHTKSDYPAMTAVSERTIGGIDMRDQLQEVILHLDVGGDVLVVTHVIRTGLAFFVITIPHDKNNAVLVDQRLDHFILQLGAWIHVVPSAPSVKKVNYRTALLTIMLFRGQIQAIEFVPIEYTAVMR